MKKVILAGILVSLLVPTVAYAGTKTKTFSYNNDSVAEGKLTTIWSTLGNDQGYASTKMTKGERSVATYVESQDKANGARTDWDSVNGSDNTKTISRKGVWRFNSTHSMKNSNGASLASTTQTDW